MLFLRRTHQRFFAAECFEPEGAFPAGTSIARSRVMMIGLLVLCTSSIISRHFRQNSTSGILFMRICAS